MVEIVKNLVLESRYWLKCPYTMVPKYVVIHNTANDAPAANEIAYMRRNDLEDGFHYAVDDQQIVQGVPENRNAWHSGDGHGAGNMSGIAIEICYSKSGGAKFTAAEKNAAELAASLLKKYGFGIDRLKKHQDFDGKYCPHRTLDLGWSRFVKMVEGYLSPAPKPTPAPTPTPSAEIKAGDKLTLSGVALYKSSTAKEASGTKSGTFYAWDSKILSGRIRITTKPEMVGVAGQVTGWINVTDVKQASFQPYTVRTTCEVLNIREKPTTDSKIIGQIKDKLRYTIVAESGKWGKLKSGGWIALEYITKA